jgi:hypothetical protein
VIMPFDAETWSLLVCTLFDSLLARVFSQADAFLEVRRTRPMRASIDPCQANE